MRLFELLQKKGNQFVSHFELHSVLMPEGDLDILRHLTQLFLDQAMQVQLHIDLLLGT
jgi:hypothetical protein